MSEDVNCTPNPQSEQIVKDPKVLLEFTRGLLEAMALGISDENSCLKTEMSEIARIIEKYLTNPHQPFDLDCKYSDWVQVIPTDSQLSDSEDLRKTSMLRLKSAPFAVGQGQGVINGGGREI